MFGLRGLFGGDAMHHRRGGGCYGDASAAMFNECYERPRMANATRGCEPEGFAYSATPRHAPYYAARGFGGGCGGGLFGGGGGLFRGLFGGFLGRIIGRLFNRGGGGGGGGYDNSGFDDSDFEEDSREPDREFDRGGKRNDRGSRRYDRGNDGFDDGQRYDGDRPDRERYDRDRERLDRERDRKRDEENSHKDQKNPQMSEFEQESLRLINNFRRKNGLHAVQFDPRLQQIALVHSQYQDAHGLGHNENRRGWETPSRRMQQVGLNGWAENAGYGQFRTPQQLIQMWIDSPGHRRALLDPNVKIAGISKYGKGATLDLV